MKTKKNKAKSEKAKKQIKKDLEIGLISKLSFFVKSLGYDVNDLSGPIKKASKLFAKKIAKKSNKKVTVSKVKKKAFVFDMPEKTLKLSKKQKVAKKSSSIEKTEN